jgi:hypothetical protein
MIRDILNYEGVKVGELELPDGSSEDEVTAAFRKLFPDRGAVSDRIQIVLQKFDKDTTDYIYRHYPAPSQQSLLVELVYAMFTNMTNKAALIASVREWAGIVLEYHFSKWSDIEACTTHAELDAMTWDFSQFDDLDPQVALRDVLQMTD